MINTDYEESMKNAEKNLEEIQDMIFNEKTIEDRHMMGITPETKKRICSCCAFYSQPTYVACRHCQGFDKFETSAKTEENSMICNRREEIEERLISYINKPVYVKGYCWGRKFDGWTVIYDDGTETFSGKRMVKFDYSGKSYTANGFLPSRFTLGTDSSYGNAFYRTKGD